LDFFVDNDVKFIPIFFGKSYLCNKILKIP
jgi:hypothetical protein